MTFQTDGDVIFLVVEEIMVALNYRLLTVFYTKEKQLSEVCKWTLLTFQNFLLPSLLTNTNFASLVLNFSHYVAKLKLNILNCSGNRKRYLCIYGKTFGIIINTRYCFQYFYLGKLFDLQFTSEICWLLSALNNPRDNKD